MSLFCSIITQHHNFLLIDCFMNRSQLVVASRVDIFVSLTLDIISATLNKQLRMDQSESQVQLMDVVPENQTSWTCLSVKRIKSRDEIWFLFRLKCFFVVLAQLAFELSRASLFPSRAQLKIFRISSTHEAVQLLFLNRIKYRIEWWWRCSVHIYNKNLHYKNVRNNDCKIHSYFVLFMCIHVFK